MPDGMTFSENVQNEKQKWKRMNGKQRWDYFKAYYMIPTIIILFFLAIAITFVLQAFVFRKNEILSGFVFNEYLEEDVSDSIQEELLEFIGGDPKTDEVTFTTYQMTNTDYKSLMVVTANASAQSLDFLIMDPESLEILSTQGILADINDCLPAADLAEYIESGKIAEAIDQETGEKYPAVLDISDSSFVQAHWAGQQVYLGFSVSSLHEEDLPKVLEFLTK